MKYLPKPEEVKEAITIQQWRARCRACKWEAGKDFPNKEQAIKAYRSHSRKHMAIESVERRPIDINVVK
jgi:hypothetical protein